MEKTDIKSLSFPELEGLLLEMGEKPYRAGQVFGWLHQKLVTDFGQMANLPQRLRKGLEENCFLAVLETAEVKVSRIDNTCKYLFRLADGNVIESVRMQYHHGCSVCISSQAGCRMGCRFCASTLEGLERNLTASEMLEQVYRIQQQGGGRVSHIVIMGSGEPFDNYENIVRFLRLVSDERGLNISLRNITVSTCGIVPGIRRFAEEGLPVTLALSLHAPNDKVRQKLMPVAKTYPLDEVLAACREYFEKTGRRLTFEYSLVKGVNDNPGEAAALARLLKGLHGHVNLIPVNPVRERDFVRSDKRAIQEFKEILERAGIAVTIRREMGRDIQGACGQLRRSFLEKQADRSPGLGKENEGG
ncbi:MAG: 23S rRNA (adenine(2503)-C(2))-methyltransferase RlmN [Lachnospiraceae bacterium]|nr:23S rRNA (adenine(2503)-C(2))-methyltransferase RlmN [Lachnospiraceae bacterium]